MMFFVFSVPSVLFFHAKCYASTLILLRDTCMLGKTSLYSIDISGNDRHILLVYKKCHLLPFAEVGQFTCLVYRCIYFE